MILAYLESIKTLVSESRSYIPPNVLIDKKKNAARIGTPHWMAPEIMREEVYDEYSDVYSYGMILWEILAGKVPYFSMSVQQIVGSVGYGDNQVSIPENGNQIIINVMIRCLSKQRKERPSFKEIISMIIDDKKQKNSKFN